MSKTYKGDVTGNVVELNLLDANESTLPNLGTPTVVTKNTGANVVEQIVGSISSHAYAYDINGGYDVKGLVIGTSCTSIGNYAFYLCNSLTGSLTIPNSVTTIGVGAFGYCSGLTGSLTIPNSVTTIGNYAFYYCQNLNVSLVIPDSVTSIANGAFYSCSNLTAVYVDTPASSWIGTNALINTTFSTIYTGPNATGYTSSFQGRTGLTIANWDNYPNPIPN